VLVTTWPAMKKAVLMVIRNESRAKSGFFIFELIITYLNWGGDLKYLLYNLCVSRTRTMYLVIIMIVI
jgi:hypothetical protein